MPERIAIVIPLYNHARYIGEALESVLRQSRRPDRVIVLDDGSKDDSVAVARRYADQGVEVLTQENQGAHNTINTLVQMAAQDCDWIGILNSDDRYLPGRLAAIMEAAARQPGKAVFCTGLQVMDENGALLPETAPRSRWFHGAWSLGEQEGIGLAEWLGQANFVATTSNVLARASYLAANPFRPYRFNHDYFFLATAMLEEQLAVVPERLMDYRVHGSNTITTRPDPLIREMVRMHLDLYHHHAVALREQPDMRKRFYAFARASWDNMSSFHAGLFQVAVAQALAQCDDPTREALAAGLSGPELEEFPNRLLTSGFDGTDKLSHAGVLVKKVEQLQSERAQLKKDKEALEKLSRYRQRLLRSWWVRLGLICGAAAPIVSNRGKTPHEKMLWLRDTCQGSWWLRLGEKLGSKSCSDLRRDQA